MTTLVSKLTPLPGPGYGYHHGGIKSVTSRKERERQREREILERYQRGTENDENPGEGKGVSLETKVVTFPAN